MLQVVYCSGDQAEVATNDIRLVVGRDRNDSGFGLVNNSGSVCETP